VLPLQQTQNNKKFLTIEDVPGSIRSDDKQFQNVWKPVYCHYLFDEKRRHDKIFCGDNNAISKSLYRVVTSFNEELNVYRWLDARTAVYRRFIYIGNREETSAQILVIDVDAPGCWGKWEQWGLPCPHLEVINPQSGNVQWHYLLTHRVYEMEAYHETVKALTMLVRDGKDKDGDKNLQYRSPFLRVNGKRKTATKHGNSVHVRSGKLQAFYALVIPHDVEEYTLDGLLKACRLVDVAVAASVASSKNFEPTDPQAGSEGRNSSMFVNSWKVAAEQYRSNGGTITEAEVYGIYKANSSDLPDEEVQRAVTRFMKWAAENHERIMAFKPGAVTRRKRWSDGHIRWDKIARHFQITVDQARYRFGSHEKGVDALFRKSKKLSIILPFSSVLGDGKTGTTAGTSKGGRGNSNPEVVAIMESNPGMPYPTAKKRWQRARKAKPR
jgi:hypothetical protein